MGRSALAERPSGGDSSQVDDAAVLALLAEADASLALPGLGGMARPNGVAIVSQRVWCYSRTDGAAVSTGRMPRPPARLARLPFARGLAKLAVSLAPLLSRKGAARRGERLFLLAVLLAPLPLAAVPGAYRTVALAVSIVAVLAWMLRGRTLRLHGAEHRAARALLDPADHRADAGDRELRGARTDDGDLDRRPAVDVLGRPRRVATGIAPPAADDPRARPARHARRSTRGGRGSRRRPPSLEREQVEQVAQVLASVAWRRGRAVRLVVAAGGRRRVEEVVPRRERRQAVQRLDQLQRRGVLRSQA